MEYWVAFQESLSSDKRRYPIRHFQAFCASARQYAELTRSDALLHRDVAGAVNGLLDFLKSERKRVPGDLLRDADRLECILFGGYDPDFEGDEPPELRKCVAREHNFNSGREKWSIADSDEDRNIGD